MTEVTVAHPAQQAPEIFTGGVYQVFMVTRLEIDVGQADQGLIKECLDAVGWSQRRYGPHLAVTEEFCEIILAGEVQLPFKGAYRLVIRKPVSLSCKWKPG